MTILRCPKGQFERFALARKALFEWTTLKDWAHASHPYFIRSSPAGRADYRPCNRPLEIIPLTKLRQQRLRHLGVTALKVAAYIATFTILGAVIPLALWG